MVQAAAAKEWIDGDLIITYSACEAARWLNGR